MSAPATLSGRAFRVALALVVAVFVVHALYLARTLVPSQDETGTLFLGYLAASGQIGLYDDQVIGHRPPVPFYVFGMTQVVSGRSLFAGRLLGVAFGAIVVALTGVLAARLGGRLAGLLAAAVLTGQGALVGYYAMADYHALVPAMVLTGTLLHIAAPDRWRNVGATAVFALLFLVRTHVMPLIPFVTAISLWRARGRRERALIVAAAAAPPLAFFLWDPKHLKLLAYVTGLNRLVQPLGYYPAFAFDARPQESIRQQIGWLVHLGRRYEFLALVTIVALAIVIWRVARSRAFAHYRSAPGTGFVVALFLWGMASLFVLFHINFKWIGMYFATYAPVLAALLGVAWSRIVTDPGLAVGWRRALATFLVLATAAPVYWNRSPLMPIGEVRVQDPFVAIQASARELASLVPPTAKIFFYGQSDVYYYAGLPPTWFPPVYNFNTLAANDWDNWATTRSGFWGLPQLERWLGVEAEYAVVSPEHMLAHSHHNPAMNAPKIERMKDLLGRHFERVGTVRYVYYTYEVYRRRGAPRASYESATSIAVRDPSSVEFIELAACRRGVTHCAGPTLTTVEATACS